MKKTFLAKRNALLSSANVSWGAFALVVAILLLLIRLLVPNFFWYAFEPVFRASDSLAAGSHTFLSSFGDVSKLTLQNEKLASENAALAMQNKSLLQNMDTISRLAGDAKGIIAGIVARPPESPYDTLVLAAGSNAGIKAGMEAFGADGVPLGIVYSVLAGFSRVTLFSSPNMSTNGWVGQKNMPITIKGFGAGTMNSSVSRSAGIAAGDVVSIPGPGMLPVGVVVRVDSDPTSPSVTLRIQPAPNLFSISWVELRDTGITAFTLATSTSL